MTNSVLIIAMLTLTFQTLQSGSLPGKKANLQAGTPILLELAEALTADQVATGTLVPFKVTTDVTVGGKVAIRTGATAWGRVKNIVKATYSHPARIYLEVQHVQAVDGQQVPLNGEEQVLSGRFSGQGFQAAAGTAILAATKNDNEIKTQ